MFAVELSTQIKERYKLCEKCSLVQKECEGVESFKESSFEKESTKAQSQEAICEKLNSSKSAFEDEILFLEKKFGESKHSEQDELMVSNTERILSLRDDSKSLKSQVADAEPTFKVFQMNEDQQDSYNGCFE